MASAVEADHPASAAATAEAVVRASDKDTATTVVTQAAGRDLQEGLVHHKDVMAALLPSNMLRIKISRPKQYEQCQRLRPS